MALLSYTGQLGVPHVEARAFNSGSDAVTVTDWGFDLGHGQDFRPLHLVPLSAALPHRLEGGADAIFYILGKDLGLLDRERGVRFSQMRPRVRLGTGQTVRSRKGLPIWD